MADLSPYSTFKVKIKVELVGNVKQIEKKTYQGRVLNCILSDGSGQIKLSAFSREGESNVEEMQEQLKEGSVYLVSGSKVKLVNETKYNRTGHMFEMIWTNKTKVEPLPGEKMHLPYNVQPLSKVAVSKEGCILDVIGVVKEVKPCTTTPSRCKVKLYHLSEVVLEDSSGTAVLNLWESKATDLPDIYGKVLAVRRGQVQEHEGKKSLSIMFTGSYEVEPASVGGVLQLVKQYQGSLPELQMFEEGGKGGDKDGKERESRRGRKRKVPGETELEGGRNREEGEVEVTAKIPKLQIQERIKQALNSKEGHQSAPHEDFLRCDFCFCLSFLFMCLGCCHFLDNLTKKLSRAGLIKEDNICKQDERRNGRRANSMVSQYVRY